MNRNSSNQFSNKDETTLEQRTLLMGTATMDLANQMIEGLRGLSDASEASDRPPRVRPSRIRAARPTDEPTEPTLFSQAPTLQALPTVNSATREPNNSSAESASNETTVLPEREASNAVSATPRSSGTRPSGERVYFQDFNDLPEGQLGVDDRRAIIDSIGDNVTYIKGFGTESQVNDDPDQRGREAAGQINEANDIVRVGFEDGALKATYPRGGNTSSHSGVQYEDEIANDDLSGGAIDEAVISYKVKVDKDFPWQSGGKLPGVIARETYRGDDRKHSIRLMWREEGKLEFYIHTPDSRTRLFWDNGNDQLGHAALTQGEWADIEFRVKLNSFKDGVAVADGQLEGWINGKHAGYHDNVILRDAPTDNINTLFFSTFYGGSSGDGATQWWPNSDSSALFDDISVERI